MEPFRCKFFLYFRSFFASSFDNSFISIPSFRSSVSCAETAKTEKHLAALSRSVSEYMHSRTYRMYKLNMIKPSPSVM